MIPGIVAQASSGTSNEVGLEGVELLLGFNAANNLQRFADEGRRSRPVAWYGNAKISTTQSKFGGSSYAGDGNNDGLFIPPGPGLLFGAEPFTVEGWFRFNVVSGTTQFCIAHRVGNNADQMAWSLVKRQSDNRMELWVCKDDINRVQLLSINPVVANTWYHMAFDRDEDGVLRFYIDGVMQASEVGVTTVRDFRKAITIGIQGERSSALNGYADEIRIVKGTAVYGDDAGFIPPAGPFPRPELETAPEVDSDFVAVKLLVGFDGPQGSYDLRDDSPAHRVSYNKVGNGFAAVGFNSKVQGRLGGPKKAVYSTTGTGIFYEDSADWVLGTAPFTIEAWVRQDAFATCLVVGQRQEGGSTNQAWNLTLISDGKIEWQMVNTAGTGYTLQTPVPDSNLGRQILAWNHVAVTRDATGKVRIYCNGEMLASEIPATNPFDIRDVANPLMLFAQSNLAGLWFVGDADEVRVTKGVARYTTDTKFPVPETPFWRDEDGPPVFSEAPSITSRSGFFAVGDVLDLDVGASDGYDPVVQWRRNGVAIPGATGRAYALFPDDSGAGIDATVTAWNYQGETVATAPTVGPVAAAPVYDSGALAPAGDMQSGGDRLIPAGDAQSGGDVLLWKERTL